MASVGGSLTSARSREQDIGKWSEVFRGCSSSIELVVVNPLKALELEIM